MSDPYTDHDRPAPPRRAAPAPRLPRIPSRYHSALAGTAMTIALTAVVSLGMTIRSAGLTLEAGGFWLTAWQFAALIAVPTRFVLAPLVAKAVRLIVEPPLPQN